MNFDWNLNYPKMNKFKFKNFTFSSTHATISVIHIHVQQFAKSSQPNSPVTIEMILHFLLTLNLARWHSTKAAQDLSVTSLCYFIQAPLYAALHHLSFDRTSSSNIEIWKIYRICSITRIVSSTYMINTKIVRGDLKIKDEVELSDFICKIQ